MGQVRAGHLENKLDRFVRSRRGGRDLLPRLPWRRRFFVSAETSGKICMATHRTSLISSFL